MKTTSLCWLNGQIRALRQLEKDDLDWARAGQWPDLLKILILTLLLGGLLFASHRFLISDLQQALEAARQEQERLLQEYQQQAFQTANLDTYAAQALEVERVFNERLTRLPAAREVPRLLEDIQTKARAQNLDLHALRLGDEVLRNFYTEWPFEIRVQGDFHQLALFLEGISRLDRMVTFHDLNLIPADSSSQPRQLNLVVQARIYRYEAPRTDE